VANADQNLKYQSVQKQAPIPKHNILYNISKVWRKLEKSAGTLSQGSAVIGIIAIVMMVLITCIEVLGNKFFDWGVPDFTGTVGIALLVAMSFAMGSTYLGGLHIKVELLKHHLPGRAQAALGSINSLLGFGLFVLLIWQLVALGWSFQTSGEITQETHIPLCFIAYAAALGCVPVALILLHQLGNSLSKLVQK